MAEIDLIKISELPATSTIGDADELAVVQGGATKKVPYSVLKDGAEVTPDTTLSEAGVPADAAAVGAALAQKANQAAVTQALDAKADKTEVAGISGDIEELASVVERKADKTALNQKADKATTDALRQDLTTLNGIVNQKADKTELNAQIGNVTAELASKANTADVNNLLAAKANVASPVFTGRPQAPTAPKRTATLQLATTAFVQNAIDDKEDKLTFDSAPTQGSTNPVTSGGVWEAVQTDKTLAVEDKAADAKVTGEKVAKLKNGIYELYSGMQSLFYHANWETGMLAWGDSTHTSLVVSKTEKWRVCSADKLQFAYDTVMHVATGFRVVYLVYQNGGITDYGWKTGDITIPANTIFCLTIARTTDDRSETADVIEYVNAVTIDTKAVGEIAAAFKSYDTSNITDFSDDLNNLDKVGFYSLSANKIYDNSPSDLTSGFGAQILIVYEWSAVSTSKYTIQMLITNYGIKTRVYMRVRGGAPLTWLAWNKVYDYELAMGAKTPDNIVSEFTRSAQASQGLNNGDKIRVMSYNICNYNHDSSTYINDTQLIALRRMLASVNADVVLTQEDRQYIDSGNTLLSQEYVYYPIYAKRQGVNGVAIETKQEVIGSGIVNYTNGGQIRWARLAIGSKLLLMVSTHPSPGFAEENIAQRDQQYHELVQWVNGEITLPEHGTSNPITAPEHTHVIIGADTNAGTPTDRENLANRVANGNLFLANGGRFGWIGSCYYQNELYPIDNIIVSNNVIIESFDVLTSLYSQLHSDHVPVYADLTLL